MAYKFSETELSFSGGLWLIGLEDLLMILLEISFTVVDLPSYNEPLL